MAKYSTKYIIRKLELFLIPPLAYIILYFIYFTCRKRYHFNKERVEKSPVVFVFWHGDIVILPFGYRNYRSSKNIDVIISQHHNGEIATRIQHLLGGGTIRGSSSRGGIGALKGALRSLKSGKDIGMTPDGPKGPRHSVADGAVLIAQKRDVPIVAMSCRASREWNLKSWDRLSIPKPFCTLDYYYSDPFYVTDESLESAKEMIKERLMRHAF